MSLTPSEIRLVVAGALLGMFLAALDQAIVATAMPTIARDLGDLSLISWIVSVYLLASTCVPPIVGKLSDLYGRRVTLITCLGIFMLGSALCALAQGMLPLILARGLQGIGGGSLITLGQAVVADIATPRERARYSAAFSTVFASASVLGPMLGGFLTDYLGWPWIFWINLPLCVVAIFVVNRGLRNLPPRHQKSPIDYRGITALLGATVSLLMVVSLGGKKLPWASPETLGLAVVAVVLGFIFARQQTRAPEPILPPRFLADPVLKPLLASSFVFAGVFVTITVVAPIYFQVALGVSASTAGLLIIPLLVSTSGSAGFVARYTRMTGRTKLPALYSVPVAIAGCVGIWLFADRVSAPVASLILMLIGLGVGPTYPISSIASLNAVGPRDFGAVSGAVAFSRSLGSAIGVAAGSALVLGLAASALPDYHYSGLEDLVRENLPPDVRAVVSRAFGTMFGAAALVFVVGLLIYTQMEDRLLRDNRDKG